MSRQEKTIVAAIIILLVAAVPSSAWIAYGTQDTVIVTVSKTERVMSGSGENLSHKYLVFTKSETFENTDSLWHGKFSSSDIQGSLEERQTYRLKVYGFRIPFLSMYRNIIKVEKI